MSRTVFEFYFDPEDLGPKYAEFSDRVSRRSEKQNATNRKIENRKQTPKTLRYSLPESTPLNGKRRSIQVCESKEPKTEKTNSGKVNGKTVCASTARSAVTKSDDRSHEPEAQSSESTTELDRNEADSTTEEDNFRIRKFVSVHAFGQFVFCQRAGILAAESNDEVEPDEPLPRLNYLPNFDREKIEEQLSANLNKGLMGFLYVACLAMLIVIGIFKENQLLVTAVSVVLSVAMVWEVVTFTTVVRLIGRRRKAIKAEAKSPDPNVTDLQPANWWSMLNAGFESANYQRPFRHPDLPLEGCPWRVLERDSLRIPVIRASGERLGNRMGELFPKYHARVVAYAVLLEATNHIVVPYGLVFPHDNPKGLAVPITDDARERVRETLDDFVSALKNSQTKSLQPELPKNRNRCDGCAFGKPKPISHREIEKRQKSGAELVVLHNYHGAMFECQCSNRFGSVPPHKETSKRRLVAAIQ